MLENSAIPRAQNPPNEPAARPEARPVGPHDTAILNLIAGQQALPAIYQAGRGRWNSLDVADVLARYQFTVNQGGSIVRSDVPAERVLTAGLRSTSQQIRNRAARAEQMLVQLSRDLGAESARAQLRVLHQNSGGGR